MTATYFWLLFTGIVILLGILGLTLSIKLAKDKYIAFGMIGGLGIFISLIVFLNVLIDADVFVEPINSRYWCLYLFPGIYFILIIVVFLTNFTDLFNLSNWYTDRYYAALDEIKLLKKENRALEDKIFDLQISSKCKIENLINKQSLQYKPTNLKLNIV